MKKKQNHRQGIKEIAKFLALTLEKKHEYFINLDLELYGNVTVGSGANELKEVFNSQCLITFFYD